VHSEERPSQDDQKLRCALDDLNFQRDAYQRRRFAGSSCFD
jgi:hypothetical protein